MRSTPSSVRSAPTGIKGELPSFPPVYSWPFRLVLHVAILNFIIWLQTVSTHRLYLPLSQASFHQDVSSDLRRHTASNQFSWTSMASLRASESRPSVPGSTVSPSPSPSATVLNDGAGDASIKTWVPNSSFNKAVALLQADIVALCIQSGIEPEKLWPPPALLMNLSVLHAHAIDLVHQRRPRAELLVPMSNVVVDDEADIGSSSRTAEVAYPALQSKYSFDERLQRQAIHSGSAGRSDRDTDWQLC
jgi:hypothetical protein